MYRLANIFNWKDRPFELSDEGCWLDLLDDFGPALPRFLLDDSCVASIPEGDDALDELRQSLVKHPISSLKPEVGSVWVLFAFKENLASLPMPFRRDGILLPFEWRADEERHSELLPDGLVRLADRVKGQFGTAAASYTLHPSRHFLDTVDFNIPGATFDSAWGALATGLHLLLSGKKHLTAWPFSTIAYDFAADAPAAVGELERKFLLAASCGAEEIAVAPVQYREARKVLSGLQDACSGNKALAHLRVYCWKPVGDIGRSIAQLAWCNQGKRSKLLFRCCMALTFIAGALSVFLYDIGRHVNSYFADIEVSGTIWKGNARLSQSETDDRDFYYRFTYCGYDAVFAFGRRQRLLRSVECLGRDGKLKPIPKRVDGKKIARVDFTHGSDKRLLSYKLIDVHQRPREQHYLVDGKTNEVEIGYYDDTGYLMPSSRTHVNFKGDSVIEYKDDGNYVMASRIGDSSNCLCIASYDGNNIQTWDNNGVSEIHVFYDGHQREAAREFYGLNSTNRVVDHQGISGWTNIYNTIERSTTRKFLSPENKATCGSSGCFAVKMYFDDFDSVSRVEFLNESGELMLNAFMGVAGWQNYKDESGFVTNRWAFNESRMPCSDNSGAAKIVFSRIKDDTIRLSLYNENGAPHAIDGVITGEIFVHNNEGLVTEVTYLGKNGIQANSQGIAKCKILYDKFDRLSRIMYFDEHDNPAKMSQYYDTASQTIKFDDIQTEGVDISYPPSGNVVFLYKQYKGAQVFYVRTSYSKDGRGIKSECLREDMKTLIRHPREGYAVRTVEYNSRGEYVTIEWRDENEGLAVSESAGVAWIRRDISHTDDGIEVCQTSGRESRMPLKYNGEGCGMAYSKFDNMGRLVRRRIQAAGGEVISDMQYMNDTLGRLTNIVLHVQNGKAPGLGEASHISFVYDKDVVWGEFRDSHGNMLCRKTNAVSPSDANWMPMPLNEKFEATFGPPFQVQMPSLDSFLTGRDELLKAYWYPP